jgi:signal transduction histidine kinase
MGRIRPIAALTAATLVVGYCDYATGPNVLLTAFYVLTVALAAWTTGFEFASLLAVLAVILWLAGNRINGDATVSSVGLTVWNCGVELALFLFVAFAVDRLRADQRELEDRVRERTASLEHLQQQLLESGEREQRRIGQELHDGLCQHLAGVAYLGQTLHDDLEERGAPEAQSAEHIVELIKEGVLLARQTAKGLDPVPMDAEGLMHALEDFAASSSRLFDVSCRFACDLPVLISSPAIASNLFRIAQESVRNAIAHGKAKNILIRLLAGKGETELRIEDDGLGIATLPHRKRGMGMMIMPRRAASIGATFEAVQMQAGGTRVIVRLPDFAENGELPA